MEHTDDAWSTRGSARARARVCSARSARVFPSRTPTAAVVLKMRRGGADTQGPGGKRGRHGGETRFPEQAPPRSPHEVHDPGDVIHIPFPHGAKELGEGQWATLKQEMAADFGCACSLRAARHTVYRDNEARVRRMCPYVLAVSGREAAVCVRALLPRLAALLSWEATVEAPRPGRIWGGLVCVSVCPCVRVLGCPCVRVSVCWGVRVSASENPGGDRGQPTNVPGHPPPNAPGPAPRPPPRTPTPPRPPSRCSPPPTPPSQATSPPPSCRSARRG